MKITMVLQGQSPAMPLDLIVGALGQARASGCLRAVTRRAVQFRLLFRDGRLAYAQSGATSSFDPIEIVRVLLVSEVRWAFEPMDVVSLDRPTLPVEGVLLEVARRNDHAERALEVARG